MVTLLILLLFIAFFLLYNTSKKAELSRNSFPERWAQDHALASKIIGLLVLFIGLGLCLSHFGIGPGIFGFFVILMTIASCVVLFAPLRYFPTWVLASVIIVSFLFEFIWK
jgi:hypothetical protein